MPANLARFPDYNLEMGVLSGAVTDAEMLQLYSAHDQNANWLGVYTKSADLSGVDIACFPALKRALAGDGSNPADGEPKLSALVNLAEPNDLFVRFWAHYASEGVSRKRRMFPAFEPACLWLGLPASAAERLAAAAAAMEAGPETGAAEATETRRRLVKAAGRIFRERGFEGMTLDEVVATAGVARGDLGGLAVSKDDLIVHALLDAMGDVAPAHGDLAQFAAEYLSPAQKADVAGGCAMAALASETIRQSPEARAAMTAGLIWHVERLSRVAPGPDEAARHRAAVRAWSAMIGAMILARVSDSEALSQEFLDEARAWIADPAVAAAAATDSAASGVRPFA